MSLATRGRCAGHGGHLAGRLTRSRRPDDLCVVIGQPWTRGSNMGHR